MDFDAAFQPHSFGRDDPVLQVEEDLLPFPSGHLL